MYSLIQTFRASSFMVPNLKVLLKNSCVPIIDVSSGIKTKTLESKLGIPEKPKKPLTPFFQYMTEIRSSVQAAHPQLSLSDVVKAIGVKWETVEEAKKKQYMDIFKQKQAVYLQERAKYELSLTDEQRQDLKDLKQKIVDARQKTVERKRVRELGRPKRAMSPFLLYLNEAKVSTPRIGSETYREWQVRCSKNWHALSISDKEPYIKQGRVLVSKYSDELLQWEEKMVLQGNADLVRNHMLVEPLDRPKKVRAKKSTKTSATPIGTQ